MNHDSSSCCSLVGLEREQLGLPCADIPPGTVLSPEWPAHRRHSLESPADPAPRTQYSIFNIHNSIINIALTNCLDRYPGVPCTYYHLSLIAILRYLLHQKGIIEPAWLQQVLDGNSALRELLHSRGLGKGEAWTHHGTQQERHAPEITGPDGSAVRS